MFDVLRCTYPLKLKFSIVVTMLEPFFGLKIESIILKFDTETHSWIAKWML